MSAVIMIVNRAVPLLLLFSLFQGLVMIYRCKQLCIFSINLYLEDNSEKAHDLSNIPVIIA